MRVRDVLNEAFDLYMNFWRHLMGAALAFYLVASGITLGFSAAWGQYGALAAAFVLLVGGFWLTGALVEAVADIRDGRVDLSVSETFARVWPRVLTLLAASILAGLGIVAGFLFFIIPGLVLWTWWSLITAAIVLEDEGVFESFGRSRQLVRPHPWIVFGTLVATYVLMLITSGIIGGIFGTFLPKYVGHYVGNVVGGTVTAPFLAVAVTVLYFRLAQPAEPAEPAHASR